MGIPCISSDITEIKLSHVAGIFGLREEEIRRRNGPVSLLVGIDHPKLHTGETRQAANLIARQSPLGWVIVGATPGKHEQVNCVFSVKVPTPIDMTDFWTTETMEVATKPCECEAEKISPVERRELKIIEDSCQKIGHQWLIPYPWKRDPKELPNNEVQAKKKLEATERRLSKTPEHAAAYDRQMMEMTDAVCTQAHKAGIGDIQWTSPLHCPPRDSETRKDNTHPHSLQLICLNSRPSTE